MKHKTQSERLTRKLKALRKEEWRLMHAPLATQYRWYAAVLIGHFGYYGRPHNYRALAARSGESGSPDSGGEARKAGRCGGTHSTR